MAKSLLTAEDDRDISRRAKSKTAPQEIGFIYNYKRNKVVKNLQQLPATRAKRKKDTYEGKI